MYEILFPFFLLFSIFTSLLIKSAASDCFIEKFLIIVNLQNIGNYLYTLLDLFYYK
jgi:hypothetical protein